MAEEMTEKPTEGTTPGGKYLTRDYLVINLQKFWNKIKAYLNKALDGKVNIETDKGLSTNDFTDTDKNKLNGIAENANNYNHPTDSGNKHIPGGGREGQILRWDSDGTAVWGDDSNTTYSEVTQSAAGLMSVSDKTKLDAIESGANKTVIEQTLSSSTTNPVQGKVIKEALDLKADKEDLNSKADKENLEDPSDLANSKILQGYSTEAEGHIVLIVPKSTKHLKIYTPNSDRPIEKVSLTNNSEVLFTNFQEEDDDWTVILENPEGKSGETWNITTGIPLNFYIEGFTYDKKYKPFILQVERVNEMDLTKIKLSITKVFES